MAVQRRRRAYWRFVDGALSVSASMWVAIALNQCSICGEWPALGFLSGLAANPTGVIIVATALLFPVAVILYGGITMFFAARETVERWAAAKDAKARAQGRKEGRKEVVALLEEHNVPLPPELLHKLNGDEDSGDQSRG